MAGSILIIGGTEADERRLAAVLDHLGCHVRVQRVATPAQAAAHLADGAAPALVLLDEQLAGVSSLPVLEAIRAQVDLDRVPVVVLGDEASAHDRGFSRLGSALLARQADPAAFHEQVERLAERFLNDWVLARPMPGGPPLPGGGGRGRPPSGS